MFWHVGIQPLDCIRKHKYFIKPSSQYPTHNDDYRWRNQTLCKQESPSKRENVKLDISGHDSPLQMHEPLELENDRHLPESLDLPVVQ